MCWRALQIGFFFTVVLAALRAIGVFDFDYVYTLIPIGIAGLFCGIDIFPDCGCDL